MHLVSRLRRALAMMIVLLGLLAGLGVASANAADAPILTRGGGRQTPHVAKQTPGTLPSNAPDTPLPTPSPLTTTSPLSPETTNPSAPSSPTDTIGSTNPASTKPSDTGNETTHTVRFDPNNGSKPTQSTVKTGTIVIPPEHNPVRKGFWFGGWTLDGQPYDFQTPILQDMTLTAKWAKTTDWTLSPEHGPASGAKLTISPPSPQDPYYVSIQATGDEFVGLTGDGSIYTWTQDSTPKQVSLPARAPDGFSYLQAAAGSRWQAALGSDQHIYTWASWQATPTILDTDQNTKFTSISMNHDRLLAVDRQGQVHTYQASQSDTQDPAAQSGEQATTNLPGQAQAVLAVASGSRIMIVDADGQTWTWDATNTGKAKPTRIKQNPGIRIIQAQALNQGFLLLDMDGQAYYLADSTTSPTTLRLPDGTKASRITANDSQAIITGKDGQLCAWKPGEVPLRADKGNQHYMQAANAEGRITAISRHGSMLTWSLGAQGNPGKPTRLDSGTAPTLESASLDSQPLKLSKTAGAWQAEAPAHKPGQTAITITGRQDGQAFTRSLKYTVDQTLTRDMEPSPTHTVTFNTDSGSPTPANQKVSYPYGRVQRPSPDPSREGYQFDGWFIGKVAYDFSKPVTTDLNLTAHWTPDNQSKKWSISPDKGSQLGNETTTITPPSATSGSKFNQTSTGGYDPNVQTGYSLAVGSDGNAYAWGDNTYGQLGDGTTRSRSTPVLVQKPDPKNLPADFTYVQIAAGGQHSLAIGSDGYVYAWGYNNCGQLGNNTKSDSTKPVRVHGPGNTGEGLKAIQVSAGTFNSMALGTDGTVYTWGSISREYHTSDRSRPQTVPTAVKDPADASESFNAVQISTNWTTDLAIGQDGYLYAWGFNTNGQLGNNTSDSTFHATPSRVFATSKSTATAGPWLKAVYVSAGAFHVLAIDQEGKTWSWGGNEFGQLGNGTRSSQSAVHPIPLLVKYPRSAGTVSAVMVIAGSYHSFAIDNDGKAWAWGRGDQNQIGRYDTSYSPVSIQDPNYPSDTSKELSAVQMSGGYYHSLAIDANGKTWAWGRNNEGQLGNNDSTYPNSTPVPVDFNLSPVITKVKFDKSLASSLVQGNIGNSVIVTTPAHEPGPVTVSVDYMMGGGGRTTRTDNSLTYTYTPLGVLPEAGGEGILITLTTGITGMGGVLASRRHRRETRQLLHASHE